MKINFLLKYLVLFSILISMSNCSTDTDYEILEETKETEILQTKSGLPTVCNKTIYVQFSFPPGATQAQKRHQKNNYAILMSENFTICERYAGLGSCDNREKWLVNGPEYEAYLSSINAVYLETDDDGTGAILKPGCPFSSNPIIVLGPVPIDSDDGDENASDAFGW